MVQLFDWPAKRGSLGIITTTLQSEPPSLISITQPLALILLPSRNLCISLLVNPRMDTPNNRHDDQVHDQVRERNGMSNDISRAVTWSVQLGSNDRTNVTDRDLHCIGRRTLRLAADVDSGPRETKCDRWVDTGGGEEGTDVGDSELLSWVCVAEENAVANYSDCC